MSADRAAGMAASTPANPTGDDLPFHGLKVIDCASYIAAPAAATMLGDLGADVVKIEPPGGDPHRDLYRLPGTPPADRNYPWELDSRNKRSLVLDLKQADGQAVLHQLVAQADVFITNLPLAARQRLAIDHPRLAPLNPRLVYGSMTAYGETGPEAGKTGFDVTAYWARSGLMDLVRDDHRAPPTRPVPGLGDHPSAVALFAAISTALSRRERTGRGGLVSTSLLANGLWSNAVQVQAQLSGVSYPPRQPRELAPNPLSNIYRCRDSRWLSLVVLNEARQWPALVAALGLPKLVDDARFATTAARQTHPTALIALFDAQFAEQDLALWRQRLDAAGITFGVVGTLADIPDDAQMRAAGALLPFAHQPGLTLASPVQIHSAHSPHSPHSPHIAHNPHNPHGVAQRPPGPAPTLGQHSAAVLRDAGFADDHIRRLIDSQVVLDAPLPTLHPTTPL